MTQVVPYNLYYSEATGKAYSGASVRQLFGIDVNGKDPDTLADSYRIFLVEQNEPDFDLRLYTVGDAIYTINVDDKRAVQSWTAIAKELSVAKAKGSAEAKAKAEMAITAAYPLLILIGIASKDAADRSAGEQAAMDTLVTATNNLEAQLLLIAAATTVDEINDIINP